MTTQFVLGAAVKYSLTPDLSPETQGDGELLSLNQLLGQKLRLRFAGEILCQNCGKRTPKSYFQGYCFPCTQKLASCDSCIMKPELCHFRKGTCREPDWAKTHCFLPHTVYLANTSGPKVGITRSHQRLTRWMDQGAVQAIPLCEVQERWHSGLLEHALREFIQDRTDWRKMLKPTQDPVDLPALREEMWEHIPEIVPWQPSQEAEVCLEYPIVRVADNLTSFSLEKQREFSGELTGIKGQYLIFEDKVFNVRSHSGYVVELD